MWGEWDVYGPPLPGVRLRRDACDQINPFLAWQSRDSGTLMYGAGQWDDVVMRRCGCWRSIGGWRYSLPDQQGRDWREVFLAGRFDAWIPAAMKLWIDLTDVFRRKVPRYLAACKLVCDARYLGGGCVLYWWQIMLFQRYAKYVETMAGESELAFWRGGRWSISKWSGGGSSTLPREDPWR